MPATLDGLYDRAMVDAVECTATEHAANPLVTPPCACPRCAPAAEPREADAPNTIWLATDGRPVRHDVEDMELGRTGHSLLG